MTALTISQQAEKYKGDEFRYEMMSYMGGLNESILSEIPFLEINGGAYMYNLENDWDGVLFKHENEKDSVEYGILSPCLEILKSYGGYVQVDKAIMVMNGMSALKTQRLFEINNISKKFGKEFIHGSELMIGLKDRVIEGGKQEIENSSENGSLSFASLDKAIEKTDFPTHIIMDISILKLIVQYEKLKGEKILSLVEREDGRREGFYKGLKIVAINYDLNGEKILGFNEDDCTASVYVACLGLDGICGLQNGDLYVKDEGLIEHYYSMKIDHQVVIAALSGKCASRLKGIKNKLIK